MQLAKKPRKSKRKLKIAIAIPTYNRLEKLKVALHHIETQELDDRFELFCVISNIASQDGTTEFLGQLSHSKVKYVIHNTPEDYIYTNWRRCAEAVPDDIDWVWFHGDDDYIISPVAIKELVTLLNAQADESLKLVHICQALRSRRTCEWFRGNLLDLCNALGYHEVLGWMSSLVVERTVFKSAIELATRPYDEKLEPSQLLVRKISAYGHSAAILRTCIDQEAIFWDVPWVDPQDRAQTPESVARWQTEQVGERYFFVVDDILSLIEDEVITRPLTPMFFRYLRYTLWDRYAASLIGEVVNTGHMTSLQLEHLQRIKKMEISFVSEREKKLFLQWHQSLRARLMAYIRHSQETARLRTELVEHYNMINTGYYPFEILSLQGSPIL
jgi:glycosyltransferase involved in cell wall biosynthesis